MSIRHVRIPGTLTAALAALLALGAPVGAARAAASPSVAFEPEPAQAGVAIVPAPADGGASQAAPPASANAAPAPPAASPPVAAPPAVTRTTRTEQRPDGSVVTTTTVTTVTQAAGHPPAAIQSQAAGDPQVGAALQAAPGVDAPPVPQAAPAAEAFVAHRDGSAWRVARRRGGDALRAELDLHQVGLSQDLADAVMAGHATLLVEGHLARGDRRHRPVLVATAIDGGVPDPAGRR